jgi:hypothetical protein
MKAPTLESVGAWRQQEERERKVVDLLCHLSSVIVLEVVEKNFGCAKANSDGNKTELERGSKCLDTDPRRQFKSTMRRRTFWSSLETKSDLCRS